MRWGPQPWRANSNLTRCATLWQRQLVRRLNFHLGDSCASFAPYTAKLAVAHRADHELQSLALISRRGGHVVQHISDLKVVFGVKHDVACMWYQCSGWAPSPALHLHCIAHLNCRAQDEVVAGFKSITDGSKLNAALQDVIAEHLMGKCDSWGGLTRIK